MKKRLAQCHITGLPIDIKLTLLACVPELAHTCMTYRSHHKEQLAVAINSFSSVPNAQIAPASYALLLSSIQRKQLSQFDKNRLMTTCKPFFDQLIAPLQLEGLQTPIPMLERNRQHQLVTVIGERPLLVDIKGPLSTSELARAKLYYLLCKQSTTPEHKDYLRCVIDKLLGQDGCTKPLMASSGNIMEMVKSALEKNSVDTLRTFLSKTPLLILHASPQTPLIFATRNSYNVPLENQCRVLAFLLEHGADPNQTGLIFSKPLLFFATRSKNQDAMSLLLKHGAIPDSVTRDLATHMSDPNLSRLLA